MRSSATSFSRSPGARRVKQNPAHHGRGNREEMRTVLPSDVGDVNQAHVNFIYKRGGLHSVTGPFAPHAIVGCAPKLVVHDQCSKPNALTPVVVPT